MVCRVQGRNLDLALTLGTLAGFDVGWVANCRCARRDVGVGSLIGEQGVDVVGVVRHRVEMMCWGFDGDVVGDGVDVGVGVGGGVRLELVLDTACCVREERVGIHVEHVYLTLTFVFVQNLGGNIDVDDDAFSHSFLLSLGYDGNSDYYHLHHYSHH